MGLGEWLHGCGLRLLLLRALKTIMCNCSVCVHSASVPTTTVLGRKMIP